MPTYEYACTACGNHTEVFQRFDEAPLDTCASCGGALRKVFHAAGIVFKGSGFYATDSRSRKASTADTSSSTAPSSASSTPATTPAPATTSEGAGSSGGSKGSSKDGAAS